MSKNEHYEAESPPLWIPEDPASTPTFKLLALLNSKYSLNPPLETYEDLWSFSTTRIADFWYTVWDEVGIVGDKGHVRDKGARPEDTSGTPLVHVVDESKTPADNPEWFRDARINWAENMLLKRWREGPEARRVALVQVGEHRVPARTYLPYTHFTHFVWGYIVEPLLGETFNPASLRRVTYAELYAQVADLVSALLDLGLQPGDRIGSYCSNCIVSLLSKLHAI